MNDQRTRAAAPSPPESRDSKRGPMLAVTDWVLGHKRLVVGLWLVVWIAAVAALGPAGNSLSQEFSIPGGTGLESTFTTRGSTRPTDG